MDKELEFKFGVKDHSDFERLAEQLGTALPGRSQGGQQINHFFDTPQHLLHRNGMLLRLREEDGQQTLTHKCAARALLEDGCASLRTEIEAQLTPKQALDVLQGQLPFLDTLEQQLGSERAQGLSSVKNLLGQEVPRYLGYFKNRRMRLEAPAFEFGGQTTALCFELDESSFGPGKSEFEIEVEAPADVDLEALHNALLKVLQDAEIEWHIAQPKSHRFYAQLERAS